jgi:hypothetical protein
VRPAGTESVRETVPAKLKVLVNVTVDVREEPVVPLGDVVLIEKSPTWLVKLAVWVLPLPDPLTVME